MASWQARQRDPLFDQSTQAALERRGRELIGLGLVVLGVIVALALASYTPEDPSWFDATDADAQNWLGRFGAALSAPLFMVAGQGAWGLAIAPMLWGLRYMFHRGEERVTRAIFVPIWVAILSAYAASHLPPVGWTQSFGMGGYFGDMLMGALIGMTPFSAAVGIKLLALILFVLVFAFGAFVLGFDRVEIATIRRFLVTGAITAYDALMRALGRGAALTQGAAQGLRDRRAPAAQPTATAEPRLSGLVSRLKRAPAPDPVEPELVDNHPDWPDVDAPSQDRIRARIAEAVKLRAERPQSAPADHPAYDPTPLDSAPRAPVLSSALAAVTARLNLGRRPDADDAAFAPRAEPALRGAADDEDWPDLPAEPMLTARRADPAPGVVQPAPARKPAPSRQAMAEAQPRLRFDDPAPAWEFPPLSLLTNPIHVQRHTLSNDALEENARMLESVLDDYGVKGDIVAVKPGPVVTMYELEPAPGLKASRVIGLADDIARSMSALSARVSTVPGRSVIGIELPNAQREKVVLREILAARDFGDSTMRLPLALGKDIAGDPVVANLAKMPHLLIAGTTGSGKSVAINTMILSLLYKLSPAECRLIMIDPKMLELSVYDGIPHLLSPVVTDPKKAVVALKWVVGEMEERYRRMSKMGVRNIESYNARVRDALDKAEMFKRTVQTGFDEDTGDPIFETEEFAPETIPYIVVVVDEMADLMMVAGKEIEACIQRLAQMARASGIHIIMATQRPSVDVITGTIKANFPTRISFQVTSKIDSRTILGEQGAEQLLGMGDMLYMAGGARITRVHGPFVSDEEVEEVVNHLKSFGPPEYLSGVVDGPDEDAASDIDLVLGLGSGEGDDVLYDQAVAIVARDRKCSTSYIQRKLAIGYNKAARLVEQMEEQGVVSPANHVGKREVLVPEV
ncbi:DNA translocase FtsK 4TM domain-containing protein [Paracoccus sp. p4-l81]|uniref:DNA translocase FtsK n=1 Tax=unclassified Paracoccus (in: a-proteobacteria) TaxID=2688777 RepID=UPI0035B89723